MGSSNVSLILKFFGDLFLPIGAIAGVIILFTEGEKGQTAGSHVVA